MSDTMKSIVNGGLNTSAQLNQKIEEGIRQPPKSEEAIRAEVEAEVQRRLSEQAPERGDQTTETGQSRAGVTHRAPQNPKPAPTQAGPTSRPPVGPTGMPSELLMAFSDRSQSARAQSPVDEQTLSPLAKKLRVREQLANTLSSVYSPVFEEHIFFGVESIVEHDFYSADLEDQKLEGFVKILFLRALNQDGKRLFVSTSDYVSLMFSTEKEELVRLGFHIYQHQNTQGGPHESGVTAAEAGNS